MVLNLTYNYIENLENTLKYEKRKFLQKEKMYEFTHIAIN